MVAARFYPLGEKALRSLEYDLTAPVPEEKTQDVKEALRAGDATLARMHRAFRDAQRAAESGKSVLEWIRAVQGRAYSEELAKEVLLMVKARLKEEFGAASADPQKPPSPEQIFAFLLAWEELGGTVGVAALRELQRQEDGGLPSN